VKDRLAKKKLKQAMALQMHPDPTISTIIIETQILINPNGSRCKNPLDAKHPVRLIQLRHPHITIIKKKKAKNGETL